MITYQVLAAILWGRNLQVNLRIFVKTHTIMVLTILMINTIGNLAPQYVNLISIGHSFYLVIVFDIIGGVALFTAQPDDMVLSQASSKPKESLVSSQMWTNILAQSFVMTSIATILLITVDDSASESHRETFVVNFIFFGGILNHLMSRIGANRSISSSINTWSNKFCMITTLAIILHVTFVVTSPAGSLLQITPLTDEEWWMSCGLSILCLVTELMLRNFDGSGSSGKHSKETPLIKVNKEKNISLEPSPYQEYGRRYSAQNPTRGTLSSELNGGLTPPESPIV